MLSFAKVSLLLKLVVNSICCFTKSSNPFVEESEVEESEVEESEVEIVFLNEVMPLLSASFFLRSSSWL